mgnify:CR=1 FL=1
MLGTKDADYGRALDTLAKINEGQGRLAEAAPLYQQAMIILSESLGPDHESVAVTSENLRAVSKRPNPRSRAHSPPRRPFRTRASQGRKRFGATGRSLSPARQGQGSPIHVRARPVDPQNHHPRNTSLLRNRPQTRTWAQPELDFPVCGVIYSVELRRDNG